MIGMCIRFWSLRYFIFACFIPLGLSTAHSFVYNHDHIFGFTAPTRNIHIACDWNLGDPGRQSLLSNLIKLNYIYNEFWCLNDIIKPYLIPS